MRLLLPSFVVVALAAAGCPKSTASTPVPHPPATMIGAAPAGTAAPAKAEKAADLPKPKLANEAFLRAPADRVAKAKALVEELRAALIAEDTAKAEALVSGGALLSSVGQELIATITNMQARVRIEPLCPAGDGLFVRFVATGEIFSKKGTQGMEMYAGPDTDGTWRLFPAGPRDAIRARLVSEKARVRVDPKKGTVSGDATLTMKTGRERWVAINLDVTALDKDDELVDLGGLNLTGLEVDGTPARFQVMPGSDMIVAELSTASEMVTVRVAWEGKPGPQINYIHAKELNLHEAQPWIPLVGSDLADYDVTVESPSDFEVIVEGDPPPVKIETGWVARRSKIRSDRGTTIFGRPSYQRRTVKVGNITAVLAVAAERPKADVDDLEEGIRALHKALAVLGEPPASELRIVESTPFTPGVLAVGGRSFMALGPEAMKRTVVAHELAHSWFGGYIPNSFKGEWGGQWPESLAEFVVVWAIDDARARALRQEWADCYAPVFGDEDPLRLTRNFQGNASRAILYCKGPLLLSAVERHVGREKLQASLARFVRERANKPSTWEDIVAAIRAEAGDDEAKWVEKMLSRSGGPTFELEQLVKKDGLLTGTLLQRREDFSVPDISEEVELGFFDSDGKRLGDPVVVMLTKRKIPLSVPVPANAVFVEIDPDRRYPWKRSRKLNSGRYPIP